MKIGYARVSTRRQKIDLQHRALRDAGCTVIFSEWTSGVAKNRRALTAAIASCDVGDELVVWKLDRLGRDLFELVELARILKRRGVLMKILTGRASNIDIATIEGRALYGIFAAFAESERGAIGERAKAGIAAARLRRTNVTCKTSILRQDHSTAVQSFKRPLRCVFNRKG